MRMHYQFVMANERRAVYDYFMLICGPAPFRRIIAEPDGPAGLYRADGSYIVGSYIDDSQVDGSQVDGSQVGRSQVDGSHIGGSRAGVPPAPPRAASARGTDELAAGGRR
jgi:hypothetical protein